MFYLQLYCLALLLIEWRYIPITNPCLKWFSCRRRNDKLHFLKVYYTFYYLVITGVNLYCLEWILVPVFGFFCKLIYIATTVPLIIFLRWIFATIWSNKTPLYIIYLYLGPFIRWQSPLFFSIASTPECHYQYFSAHTCNFGSFLFGLLYRIKGCCLFL